MKRFLTLLSAAGAIFSIPAHASNLQTITFDFGEARSTYVLPVSFGQLLATSAPVLAATMETVAFVLEDPSMAAPLPTELDQAQIAIIPIPIATKGPPSPGRPRPIGEQKEDYSETDLSTNRIIDEMWNLTEEHSFANHHKAH